MNIFTLIFPVVFLLAGCAAMPDSTAVKPVSDFELDKYLGKWYEIARLDHSFERGLEDVTAEYSMRSDGKISVVNRGYSVSKNRWKKAEGRAKFAGDKDTGFLKVSFFRPFYGSYIIFELDKINYDYAFVSSSGTSYLWLLARKPDIDKEIIDRFVQKAAQSGFNTENLIYLEHSRRGK